MRRALVVLSIMLCAFGVVIGVMLKTNPAVQTHYVRYAKLLTQRFNQSCSASWVDRSSMTGWDSVLRTVDMANLSDEMADALVYGFFPTCESSYKSYPEILISDHVKNCTQKKKQGKMFNWLGGACFPSFMYDKNLKQLLKIDSCGFDSKEIISWATAGQRPTYLCKTIEEGWLEWGMALEKYDAEDFYSGGLIAAERALSSGFLSVLDPTYDEVQLIKISGDPDTEIIYGNKAWSDVNGNYFVAGRRYFTGRFFYVINDKLYDPSIFGSQGFDLEKFDKGQKINSEWFFGGFRGKIPLVKRVLNFEKKYKNLTWDFASQEDIDKSFQADYILETCELDS